MWVWGGGRAFQAAKLCEQDRRGVKRLDLAGELPGN